MVCEENHEQMSSKFCPFCGIAKPVPQKPTDKDIADKLNSIVQEVIKETKRNGYYRSDYQQHSLFLTKMIADKVSIPEGTVFVIATNNGNHIYTMDEVYQSYPFLKDIKINPIDENDPSGSIVYTMNTSNFARMFPFLYANGETRDGKFFNTAFELIASEVASDGFKQSGLPVSALLNDKYSSCLSQIYDRLYSLHDNKLAKYVLKRIANDKEFA